MLTLINDNNEIKNSELAQQQAAISTLRYLHEHCPNLNIALIHGKLSSEQKEDVMRRFKNGEVNILVATTVIEVGVDVPKANLMIIENAERLGLSQLHQLRGRVGRSSEHSYCLLLYNSPLTEQGRARIATLRASDDGFYIAQKDLELRGPGEILGTKQTGIPQFRIADLQRDHSMVPEVQRAAKMIIQQYPNLVTALIKRWQVS